MEQSVSHDLQSRGIPVEYESTKLNYTQPQSEHTYTPDFKLPNGIFVETKGLFDSDDRKKHLLVRQSNPDVDVRLLFQRAKSPITKGSKTTYAMWCDKNGIKWCEKRVPDEWVTEPKRKP